MLIVIDISTNDTEVMENAIESITELLSKKYRGVRVVGSAYSPKVKKPIEESVQAPPSQDVVETLPLISNKEHYITKDELAIYAEAYPAIDPLAEIKRAKAWLIANPKNKKTSSGIKRFINTWLSKEQNSAARLPQTKNKNTQPEGFSSFDTDEFFQAALKHGMEKYGG